MTTIEELGWVRTADNLWEFRQGTMVWSSVLHIDQQGWRAVSAINVEGPFSDVGQAMDAAEAYWKRQDVGPLAEDKA
jgi:hypothetical protein